MIYAKIKNYKTVHNNKGVLVLIENELYTQKEIEKLKKRFYDIKSTDYTITNIPKNKTCYFFGIRIEIK